MAYKGWSSAVHMPKVRYYAGKAARTPINRRKKSMDLIKELNKEALQKEITNVLVGDTVRVHG